MTNKSDYELQKWIQEHPAPDYTSESVQKKTVIAYDMGVRITLYDWIHRYDNAEPAAVMDIDDMSAEWIEEFRKNFIQAVNNG